VYLTEFEVRNIKCFEEVKLEFPQRNGAYAG
jgi:hypothetical protein